MGLSQHPHFIGCLLSILVQAGHNYFCLKTYMYKLHSLVHITHCFADAKQDAKQIRDGVSLSRLASGYLGICTYSWIESPGEGHG